MTDARFSNHCCLFLLALLSALSSGCAKPLAARTHAGSEMIPQPGPVVQACLHYEPEVVELRGRLTIHEDGGSVAPADTGLQSRRARVPVLVLTRSVDVCGDQRSPVNSEPVRGVQRVQIIPPPRVDYRVLLGRIVVIRGTLFHAQTAHHYTPVVLTARSLAAGDP